MTTKGVFLRIFLLCATWLWAGPAAGLRVTLATTEGPIVLALYPDQAPATVENFLRYVRGGFYTGTIFHRVIDGFVIQGGGYTQDLLLKPTRAPIRNESDNGLENRRGRVAMARTLDPHSATAQFFINLADNPALDYAGAERWGYTVFGQVIAGMDVVDAIGRLPIESVSPIMLRVPRPPVVIEKINVTQSPGLVEHFYRRLLGRAADPAGIAFWQQQLGSGAATAAQAAAALLAADEFQNQVAPVARLSLAVFERLPAAVEFFAWVERLRNGAKLEAIAGQFIATDEFAQRFESGLSDQTFIEFVYQNVLNRAADQAGMDYWQNELNAGLSRAGLLVNFTESAEFKTGTQARIQVLLAYQALLARAPTAAELAAGLDMPFPALIDQLLAAPEYSGPRLP